MSDATVRFALPFILPGQAQKELFHNEALTRLDIIAQAAVEEGPSGVPPAAPAIGQCWIVGTAATGAWSGHDGALAAWTGGGWRFVSSQPGMTVWNKAAGLWMHRDGTAWREGELPVARILVEGQQVIGARQAPVLSPSGGTVIDQEARAAVDQIIATLMSHGLIG